MHATFGKKFKAEVLVAEDNEINQKLIKRTLEDLGLTITIVPNGLQALEQRKSRNFDMIFMDIAMPVMDGIEATHKILEYEEKEHVPHIPIIAITANALKGDRERFMKEGLDEYITKPIKKENIISILNIFMHDKIDYSDEENVVNHASSTNVEPDRTLVSEEVSQETSETPIANIETQKPLNENEPLRVRDILVLKKSPIETKIFTSVLSKMCEKVDAASSLDDFTKQMQHVHYKVIIFDKEMISGGTLSEFSTWIKNVSVQQGLKIHSVMFTDSKEDTTSDAYTFDTVLPNQISKNELESLIRSLI